MTYHEEITTKRGAAIGAPGSSLSFSRSFSRGQRSGERGFAVRYQHVLVGCLYVERFVLFLEPDKLGFQVSYSLLEAAHLGNDAGIGTADMAK
jgi:hypothetical protein